MSDFLRDRIAAVLLPSTQYCQQSMTRPCDDCMRHAREKADAVIAALGLREERDGTYIYDIGGERHVQPSRTRYVTGWEPAE